jgi:hypothetical protein
MTQAITHVTHHPRHIIDEAYFDVAVVTIETIEFSDRIGTGDFFEIDLFTLRNFYCVRIRICVATFSFLNSVSQLRWCTEVFTK